MCTYSICVLNWTTLVKVVKLRHLRSCSLCPGISPILTIGCLHIQTLRSDGHCDGLTRLIIGWCFSMHTMHKFLSIETLKTQWISGPLSILKNLLHRLLILKVVGKKKSRTPIGSQQIQGLTIQHRLNLKSWCPKGISSSTDSFSVFASFLVVSLSHLSILGCAWWAIPSTPQQP